LLVGQQQENHKNLCYYSQKFSSRTAAKLEVDGWRIPLHADRRTTQKMPPAPSIG